MNEIWGAAFRTFIGFGLLLLLTRVMGKKQLGQMNIFTYITGIAIGNMAGDMIIHKDVKIIDGITGMVLWSALIIVIELVSMKNGKVRKVLDGEPSIVIKRGEINEDSLKKLRLNIDDLSMLLRINQVFSVRDVDYAILEPNGELSVLKKPEKEWATKEELCIVPGINKNIPGEIITDGKAVEQNLLEFGKDNKWLMDALAAQGVNNIKDVLYGELQNDETLYIQKRKGRK